MYQKIGILAVLAGVPLIRSTPCDSKFEGGKCSGEETAQGNQSVGMQTQATQGLPVDTWIKDLKDKNPVFGQYRTKSRCEGRYWKDKSNERPKGSC